MPTRDYFLGLTACFSDAPAENLGAFDALIFTFSPVRGLTPWRAARLTTENLPKPVMLTSSPFFSVLVTVSSSDSIARAESDLASGRCRRRSPRSVVTCSSCASFQGVVPGVVPGDGRRVPCQLRPRVEQALRVERALDLLVQLERPRLPLRLQAPALEPADAVLAGDRAAERDDQREQLLADRLRRVELRLAPPGSTSTVACTLPSPPWPHAHERRPWRAAICSKRSRPSASRSSGNTTSSLTFAPRTAVTRRVDAVAPAPQRALIRAARRSRAPARRAAPAAPRAEPRASARGPSTSTISAKPAGRHGTVASPPGMPPREHRQRLAVEEVEHRRAQPRGEHLAIAAQPSARVRRNTTSAIAASGAGSRRRRTAVITPSVPSEPTSRLLRS